MKPTSLQWLPRCLISLGIISSADVASAHGSHSTELSGTVERIDREKHFLLVKPDSHGEPILLQWGRWTTFVKGAEIVPPEALCAGHAEIFYRTPFFGKPALEKIILQANPARPAHQVASSSR
jgi:hypothetical protein